MKKWSILISLVIVLQPISIFAAYYHDYYGTTTETEQYMWANVVTGQDVFTEITLNGCTRNGQIILYENIDGVAVEYDRINVSPNKTSITLNFSKNPHAIKLRSNDSLEIFLVEAFATNEDTPHVIYDTSNTCLTDSDDSIFDAPEWDEYMGKIDEIISKIPPPPDWDRVADTFYERIVPRMVDDFEEMLGAAPDPPSPPSLPDEPDIPSPKEPPAANVSDRNIKDKEPDLIENPDLDDSSFNRSDIEENAEEIEFREDPTDGFDIADPADSLPEFPTDDLPIPGETDPGEWGEHKPDPVENPFPDPPEPPADDGSTIPDDPPIPDPISEPEPLPGDEIGNAPTPDEGTFDGSLFYKESPDS